MGKATLNQAQEVLKLIVHQGVDRDRLQAFIESGLLSELLAADPSAVDRTAFRSALALDCLLSIYCACMVVVDYSMSLVDMISAGRYGQVCREINHENFPIERRDTTERVEVVLVHPRVGSGEMYPDKLLAEMHHFGLRPATLPELLALGASQPDIQRRFPIIALASLWRRPGDCDNVPSLDIEGGMRTLVLKRRLGWGGGFCFACVRR